MDVFDPTWMPGDRVSVGDIGRHPPQGPTIKTKEKPKLTVNITAKHLTAIDSAVASISDMLRSLSACNRQSMRDDLRQELVLKLIQGEIQSEGLRTAARNWMLDYFRSEETKRLTEKEYASGCRIPTGRRSLYWEPKWYPPHPEAKEHDWLACNGSRIIHVKSTK